MYNINAQYPILLDGFEGQACTYDGCDHVVIKAEMHLLNGQRRIKVFLENGQHFWGEVANPNQPPSNKPVTIIFNFVEYPDTVEWISKNENN